MVDEAVSKAKIFPVFSGQAVIINRFAFSY